MPRLPEFTQVYADAVGSRIKPDKDARSVTKSKPGKSKVHRSVGASLKTVESLVAKFASMP